LALYPKYQRSIPWNVFKSLTQSCRCTVHKA